MKEIEVLSKSTEVFRSVAVEMEINQIQKRLINEGYSILPKELVKDSISCYNCRMFYTIRCKISRGISSPGVEGFAVVYDINDSDIYIISQSKDERYKISEGSVSAFLDKLIGEDLVVFAIKDYSELLSAE
jgi:hypothetical protein